ncbi:MAG: porin [Alphaproteobacteria bacterium]|nr:porin [Alphaproteobacteria bacterium]
MQPGYAAEPVRLQLGGYVASGLTLRAEDHVATPATPSVNRGAGDDRNYTTVGTTNAAGAAVNVPTTTDLGRSDQFWEAEVWFVGETTLDNGVKVGVNVQMEAYTSADQIDEHYIYVQGGFGRLVAGAENSAPYILHFGAPSPTGTYFGVEETVRFFFPLRPPPSNKVASVSTFSQLTGDANKLTYYTPRFAPGIQFGLSYTPDDDAPQGVQTVNGAVNCKGGCAFDAGNGISDNDQANHHHFIEGGFNFVRTIDGMNLGFDLGGGYGFLEKQSRSSAVGQDRLGKDRIVVTTGLSLAYAGFTGGLSFAWDNLGLQGPNNRYDWALGLTYGKGPWIVGGDVGFVLAQDGQARQAAGPGNATPVLVRRSNDRLIYAEIGGAYQLGPGIKVFSAVNLARWDGNDTATEEASGVAWSTGVALSF